jgi:hypothetical protein
MEETFKLYQILLALPGRQQLAKAKVKHAVLLKNVAMDTIVVTANVYQETKSVQPQVQQLLKLQPQPLQPQQQLLLFSNALTSTAWDATIIHANAAVQYVADGVVPQSTHASGHNQNV